MESIIQNNNQNNEINSDSNINKDIIEDKSNEIKVSKSLTTIALSRNIRWIIYSVLIFVTVLFDVDQGILSSSTSAITKDFGMTERQLGGFGSMIFLGIAIGCVFSFILINNYDRKNLLILTMTFDVLSLFLTTKTNNLFLLYFCRIIAGFTQSFLAIYVPVWSDQFGIHKYKSLMMAIIHVSSSFGYLFGYAMGILMGWKNSFYLENILIIINIIIIFVFLPSEYFSMELISLKDKIKLIKMNENKEDINTSNTDNIVNNDSIVNTDNTNTINTEEENKLIDENEEEEKARLTQEDEISLFEKIEIKDKEINKELIFNHLTILLKSKIFILMNLTYIFMFIIVSAIQFWINDYLENCLLIKDEKIRLYSFAFVIITSPSAGMILGGIFSGKLGGYDNEKAIYIPLITSLLDCILANIIPSATRLLTFLPLFWVFLFLGSILLPIVHGIILVSVDKKYAGVASSMNTFLFNFFGRLPGPNLYALYKSLVRDKSSRIPFWLLLNMAIPAFFSIFICIKIQKEKYNNQTNNIEHKFKELQEIMNNNKAEKIDEKEDKGNMLKENDNII